jgi:hypothetical protein
MSEWEKELEEVRRALEEMGWEALFEARYIQGEETETLRKGDKYLHIAYGDLEDLDLEEE